MSCTALSIPGHVSSTKGHGLGRMVWCEVVLVQPGASLQNRWHRDRAAKSSQHPRHRDLSRLWSLTSWDPAVNLASVVGDGKLMKTHGFSGSTMVWEQWGEKRAALIDPGTVHHPPELQPGVQAATGNLSGRALWLFYINLHYGTVWHWYLSAFSWGLRPAWLKTI